MKILTIILISKFHEGIQIVSSDLLLSLIGNLLSMQTSDIKMFRTV